MRLALGIEYDGTDFLGWQRLSHGRSVQATVESALSFVAAHPVEVTCAGRTDAGVHARCQVVHFDSASERSERAWTLGTNSRLPSGVAVLWARRVADDFHARYGARARRYRYRILNRPIRPALSARYVTWERAALDVEAMRAAAAALIGEHDFSAFRSVACQASSRSTPTKSRSRSRRTHSCITWCAISSVRCCRSVAASGRRRGWRNYWKDATAARRDRPRRRPA